MSDKNKNKKNFLSWLFRYHRDELTGGERNSFEKELQKDPFAEEAAEGLASLSEDEASEDISFLNKQIRRRTGRQQKLILYRIAASVTILIAVGSLVLIIDRKNSQQIAINSSPAREYEITGSQPIRRPDNTTSTKKDAEKAINAQERTTVNKTADAISSERKTVSEQLPMVEIRRIDSLSEIKSKSPDLRASEKAMAAPVAPAVSAAKARSSTKYTLTGRVVSSEDKMPVPGANVIIRGTTEGAITDAGGNFSIAVSDSGKKALQINFIGMQTKQVDAKPEKSIDVTLDPSLESLSEVVVTAYGQARHKEDEYDSESGHTPPVPVSGKAAFNKFIQNNLHRPDSLNSGKRMVVVLNFIVRSNGEIDSITVVRSPGKRYSDEAIRVLKSAPDWKPAEENGTRIDDEVRLRIVFK
jgi:TonB family protein